MALWAKFAGKFSIYAEKQVLRSQLNLIDFARMSKFARWKVFQSFCLAAPSYLPRRKIHLPHSLFTCLHGGKNFCETFPRINAISHRGRENWYETWSATEQHPSTNYFPGPHLVSWSAPVITTIITVPSSSGRRQGR